MIRKMIALTVISCVSALVLSVITLVMVNRSRTDVIEDATLPAPARMSAPWFTAPYAADPQRCSQWGGQAGEHVGDYTQLGAARTFWEHPEQVCRLTDNDGDPDVLSVAVEGEVDVSTMAYALGDVPGLDLRLGRCRDQPGSACITAAYTDEPGAEWQGRSTVTGPSSRMILVNHGNAAYPLTSTDIEHVTCHELLHGLGVSHHWQENGCLSPDWTQTVPSRSEIDAILR